MRIFFGVIWLYKALYFVTRPDQLVGDVVCEIRFESREARGHGATTTQEKSEPKRLSGRRRRRKKNGWRLRGTKKRLEKIQGAE
jgi:hypothetical protein